MKSVPIILFCILSFTIGEISGIVADTSAKILCLFCFLIICLLISSFSKKEVG